MVNKGHTFSIISELMSRIYCTTQSRIISVCSLYSLFSCHSVCVQHYLRTQVHCITGIYRSRVCPSSTKCCITYKITSCTIYVTPNRGVCLQYHYVCQLSSSTVSHVSAEHLCMHYFKLVTFYTPIIKVIHQLYQNQCH